MPRCLQTLSTMAFASGIAFSNFGTKMFPTAYCPCGGSSPIPASTAAFRRKPSGTATRMPAPSPVFSSHPHAPLWVMRTSISFASTTICQRTKMNANKLNEEFQVLDKRIDVTSGPYCCTGLTTALVANTVFYESYRHEINIILIAIIPCRHHYHTDMVVALFLFGLLFFPHYCRQLLCKYYW